MTINVIETGTPVDCAVPGAGLPYVAYVSLYALEDVYCMVSLSLKEHKPFCAYMSGAVQGFLRNVLLL